MHVEVAGDKNTDANKLNGGKGVSALFLFAPCGRFLLGFHPWKLVYVHERDLAIRCCVRNSPHGVHGFRNEVSERLSWANDRLTWFARNFIALKGLSRFHPAPEMQVSGDARSRYALRGR